MSATRSPSMTTLPASGKLTVIRPPMLDCTCPVPQSGRSGWLTSIPGDRIAFIGCMGLFLGILS